MRSRVFGYLGHRDPDDLLSIILIVNLKDMDPIYGP